MALVAVLLPPLSAAPRLLESYRRLPLAFEKQGDFFARGDGYTVELRRGELVIGTRDGTRLSWKFTATAAPEALDPLPTRTHYFMGNRPSRWRTGIPSYARVRYRNVYPGIDLIFYGKQRQLEFDFLVAPGADPRSIEMTWRGVDKIEAGPDGDLLLGPVRLKKPYIFQRTGGVYKTIHGHYVVKHSGLVAFQLGAFDRRLPLVIDPVLAFSTTFGGSDEDRANDVAVDRFGNAYVVGTTESSNFPVIPDPHKPRFGVAGTDVFVMKWPARGGFPIYSAIIGGSGDDFGLAIAVDLSGNAYVTGSTNSFNFPNVFGTLIPGFGGGRSDAFAVKLNAQGSALLYSGYLGGFGFDAGAGIAVDSSDNAYITGRTNSTDFPTTPGAFQPFRKDVDFDVFVSKINPAGTLLIYSTFLGGGGDDVGNSIAVDRRHEAFVTGATLSPGFPVTFNAFQTVCGQRSDGFLTRLNRSGSALVFSSCLGGSGNDESNRVALDAEEFPYTAGSTSSSNFPTTAADFPGSCDGEGAAFVSKWNRAGDLIYSVCVGGSGEDLGLGLSVDQSGSAAVSGQTRSPDFPVTPDALQSQLRGESDGFVAKLSPSGGGLLSSTYLGGSGQDGATGIAFDREAAAWVTGFTTSPDFPVTADAPFSGLAGRLDAFLSKLEFPFSPFLNPDGVVNGASFNPAPVAPGSIVAAFGSDLSRDVLHATTLPLAGSLAGARVFVNGMEAPLLFVSPTQVNFQMPSVSTGPATVQFLVNGDTTMNRGVEIAEAAPGIFYRTDTNRAIAQNQDFTLNEPSSPAPPGSVVIVYLTGQGPVDNPVPVGVPAPAAPLARAILPASATIGGVPAELQFLGLTPGFVGLAQANLRVPNLPPGDYAVTIEIGGAVSNSPLISVGGR